MRNAGPDPAKLLTPAAVVSLLVLVLSAGGLFTLNVATRRASEALDRLERFHAAETASYEARVNFKTQVQEWKNILLRGHVPADFATYRGRFKERSADVTRELSSLPAQLTALGLDPAVAVGLLEEHKALNAKYEEALAAYHAESRDSAFAVDAAVRGLDRKLNTDIDALNHTIEQAAAAELKASATAGQERYQTLRIVNFVLSGAAVIASFWLVFLATRNRGQPTNRSATAVQH